MLLASFTASIASIADYLRRRLSPPLVVLRPIHIPIGCRFRRKRGSLQTSLSEVTRHSGSRPSTRAS